MFAETRFRKSQVIGFWLQRDRQVPMAEFSLLGVENLLPRGAPADAFSPC